MSGIVSWSHIAVTEPTVSTVQAGQGCRRPGQGQAGTEELEEAVRPGALVTATV